MRVFLVHEIESERGWGPRIEDRYLFPTEEKALELSENTMTNIISALAKHLTGI